MSDVGSVIPHEELVRTVQGPTACQAHPPACFVAINRYCCRKCAVLASCKDFMSALCVRVRLVKNATVSLQTSQSAPGLSAEPGSVDTVISELWVSALSPIQHHCCLYYCLYLLLLVAAIIVT